MVSQKKNHAVQKYVSKVAKKNTSSHKRRKKSLLRKRRNKNQSVKKRRRLNTKKNQRAKKIRSKRFINLKGGAARVGINLNKITIDNLPYLLNGLLRGLTALTFVKPNKHGFARTTFDKGTFVPRGQLDSDILNGSNGNLNLLIGLYGLCPRGIGVKYSRVPAQFGIKTSQRAKYDSSSGGYKRSSCTAGQSQTDMLEKSVDKNDGKTTFIQGFNFKNDSNIENIGEGVTVYKSFFESIYDNTPSDKGHLKFIKNKFKPTELPLSTTSSNGKYLLLPLDSNNDYNLDKINCIIMKSGGGNANHCAIFSSNLVNNQSQFIDNPVTKSTHNNNTDRGEIRNDLRKHARIYDEANNQHIYAADDCFYNKISYDICEKLRITEGIKRSLDNLLISELLKRLHIDKLLKESPPTSLNIENPYHPLHTKNFALPKFCIDSGDRPKSQNICYSKSYLFEHVSDLKQLTAKQKSFLKKLILPNTPRNKIVYFVYAILENSKKESFLFNLLIEMGIKQNEASSLISFVFSDERNNLYNFETIIFCYAGFSFTKVIDGTCKKKIMFGTKITEPSNKYRASKMVEFINTFMPDSSLLPPRASAAPVTKQQQYFPSPSNASLVKSALDNKKDIQIMYDEINETLGLKESNFNSDFYTYDEFNEMVKEFNLKVNDVFNSNEGYKIHIREILNVTRNSQIEEIQLESITKTLDNEPSLIGCIFKIDKIQVDTDKNYRTTLDPTDPISATVVDGLQTRLQQLGLPKLPKLPLIIEYTAQSTIYSFAKALSNSNMIILPKLPAIRKFALDRINLVHNGISQIQNPTIIKQAGLSEDSQTILLVTVDAKNKERDINSLTAKIGLFGTTPYHIVATDIEKVEGNDYTHKIDFSSSGNDIFYNDRKPAIKTFVLQYNINDISGSKKNSDHTFHDINVNYSTPMVEYNKTFNFISLDSFDDTGTLKPLNIYRIYGVGSYKFIVKYTIVGTTELYNKPSKIIVKFGTFLSSIALENILTELFEIDMTGKTINDFIGFFKMSLKDQILETYDDEQIEKTRDTHIYRYLYPVFLSSRKDVENKILINELSTNIYQLSRFLALDVANKIDFDRYISIILDINGTQFDYKILEDYKFEGFTINEIECTLTFDLSNSNTSNVKLEPKEASNSDALKTHIKVNNIYLTFVSVKVKNNHINFDNEGPEVCEYFEADNAIMIDPNPDPNIKIVY